MQQLNKIAIINFLLLALLSFGYDRFRPRPANPEIVILTTTPSPEQTETPSPDASSGRTQFSTAGNTSPGTTSATNKSGTIHITCQKWTFMKQFDTVN